MRVTAWRTRLAALVLLALPVYAALAEVAVPPLTARVTDLTATLNRAQIDQLERKLSEFEKRKGSQIAVLLVPTTQPEVIEQYTIRVVDAWKLGRKGIDDGLLLLIAKQDRKLRIEVGRGLEGVVPDAVAKRVIAEVITPFFKQGDYYGGIEAGVNRLIRIIDGEPLPAPDQRKDTWSTIGDYLWIGFLVMFVLGFQLRAWFGRLIGAGLTGSVMGVLFWIVAGPLLAALGVGVFTFVAMLVLGMGQTRRSAGDWLSGHWSSGGGDWGGGSGGDSFGGGGGGFGGGGASGGW